MTTSAYHSSKEKSLFQELFEAFWIVVGAGVTVVAAIVVAALLKGWALTVLWGWFVAPVFHLPQLSLPAAIGLGAIVSFLTWEGVDAQEPERTRTERIARVIVVWSRPLLAVGFGWVVHLFM